MLSARSMLHEVLEPQTGDGTGPLSRLLRDKALSPVFQPIASLRDGSIHAHEALIRGPKGLPFHMPDALLAAARREGLLLEFEVACVVAALETWAALRQPGRLFVNLSAAAMIEMLRKRSSDAISRSIQKLGLQPRMLTIEITEQDHVTDIQALIEAVHKMREAGLLLALDDFGDGHSSLRLWSEIQPDVVKIDKYFTADLSHRPKKVQTLRALLQIAETFGTALVAEGIETADNLRIVRDLGIGLGQGYYLGRPIPQPRVAIEPEAVDVLQDTLVAVLPAIRTAGVTGRLKELQILKAPAVPPATQHDEITRLFEAAPELHALAIVQDDVPLGLIDRRGFMERYAKRYFKELYGKKPCVMFANMSPRLIEREHDIEDLIGILTSQDQRYLTEGFIVTDNGRYFGLGTGDQLVRTVTESRVEAARHANPLTFLPGNIPITEHIDRLLASGREFVVGYGDLNNFKPFNDHYGYWRGDEMIRLMAQCSVQHCESQRDFVGHVGGDDFVLVFQSDDWERRCEAIVDAFNAKAALLYDDAGRARGGIEAEDRHGVRRFFSFTTLSIGAVRVRRGQFRAAEFVANAAAEAKHEAKMANVGLLVMQGGD